MSAPAVETPITQAAGPKCSKCDATLDTEGSPRWCRKCRAKYQRDYQNIRTEMSEGRGYAAGQAVMRAALANYFLKFPSSHFSGAEINWMILKTPVTDETGGV